MNILSYSFKQNLHNNNYASSACLRDGYEIGQLRFCGISASSEGADVSLLFHPESRKK